MLSRRKNMYLAVVLSAFMGCTGPYNSGDRVLVEKFAYDAGIGHPRRFEVVVFKYPPGPIEKGIPKNYIKRLLGLPGELLAIFFGQIFTCEPDTDEAKQFEDKVDSNELWRWRHMHANRDGLGITFYHDVEGMAAAKVRQIAPGTPAEKAGLTKDDVISQVGLLSVKNVDDFYKAVRQANPKHGLMKFKVQRGHETLDVRVYLPTVLKMWETPGRFAIVRKPPDVMMAMRRIVNDNDFQPSDFYHEFSRPDGTRRIISKRWVPSLASDWDPDDAKGFANSGARQDVDWLKYQHITRTSPDWVNKPELITDFMDYNFSVKQDRWNIDAGVPMTNWVGSLMLECQLNVLKPEGEFRMELSRSVYRYQARFDLSNGQCSLFEIALDGSEKALGKPTATRVKGPGQYNLRLANFDSRLTLWVDDDLPFGQGHEYSPPVLRAKGEEDLSEEDLGKRRGPTKENDLDRPASFGSKGANVKIHHLRVWRDTYYSRNAGAYDFIPYASFAEKPKDEEHMWRIPGEWDLLRRIQPVIMYVQPGHYLCLGDNSPMSSDSRAAKDDADWGLVPQRLLLGRALMVYYPLNRAGPIR